MQGDEKTPSVAATRISRGIAERFLQRGSTGCPTLMVGAVPAQEAAQRSAARCFIPSSMYVVVRGKQTSRFFCSDVGSPPTVR
jgi:hypothetical protein